MQSNAYMVEAFTFEGRVENGPIRRFSHVRLLQVLVAKFRMIETCAPATLFRNHLSMFEPFIDPLKQIRFRLSLRSLRTLCRTDDVAFDCGADLIQAAQTFDREQISQLAKVAVQHYRELFAKRGLLSRDRCEWRRGRKLEADPGLPRHCNTTSSQCSSCRFAAIINEGKQGSVSSIESDSSESCFPT